MKKKTKNERLQALRMLIASHELGTQEEVLKALRKEGYETTQATLSRDFKRLKVAKASNMKGRYYYVLPGEAAYKRVSTPRRTTGMQLTSGFVSLHFSGNMGVVKTRQGYAVSLASNIDSCGCSTILGTVAGHDTIFILVKEGVAPREVEEELAGIIPEMNK